MQEWEHLIVIKDKDRLFINGKTIVTPSSILNEKTPFWKTVENYGVQGWEMVSFHYANDNNFNMAFKRPKTTSL